MVIVRFAAEFIELDKALNADKTNVIAFRNGYAHETKPTVVLAVV